MGSSNVVCTLELGINFCVCMCVQKVHIHLYTYTLCMYACMPGFDLLQLNSIGIRANANTGWERSLCWDNEGVSSEGCSLTDRIPLLAFYLPLLGYAHSTCHATICPCFTFMLSANRVPGIQLSPFS